MRLYPLGKKMMVIGLFSLILLGIGGCSCEDSPEPTPVPPSLNPRIDVGTGGSSGSGGALGGGGRGGSGGATTLALCGNGRQEAGEECDDANTRSGDGCSLNCHLEAGYRCLLVGRPCTPSGVPTVSGGSGGSGGVPGGSGGSGGSGGAPGPRGSGGVPGGSGGSGGSGGAPGPRVDLGSGGTTAARCGDGHIDTGESCDDRNIAASDGCSATCQTEPGYTCPQTGGACASLPCYTFAYGATTGTIGNMFEKQTCATHFNSTNLTNNTRAGINFSHPLYSPEGRLLFVDSSDVVFSLDRSANPTRLMTLHPRITPYPISLPSLLQWNQDTSRHIFAGDEGDPAHRVIKMFTEPDHLEKIISNNDGNIIFDKLVWPQLANSDTVSPLRNKILVSMQLSASAANGIYLYDRTRRDLRQLREQPEGSTASIPLVGKQPALFNVTTSPGASAISLMAFVRPDINRVDEIFGCTITQTSAEPVLTPCAEGRGGICIPTSPDAGDPVCSHTTQLTFWGINGSPCFTHDGQYILFTSEDPRNHHKEIWMVNPNNVSDVHQVTNNPEAQSFDPACFPNAIDVVEVERRLRP